jgi:hypothetical protein
MMRDMLVIVPTRGRPAAATRLIEAFAATGATTDLVFCVDNDDPHLPEYDRTWGVSVGPQDALT